MNSKSLGNSRWVVTLGVLSVTTVACWVLRARANHEKNNRGRRRRVPHLRSWIPFVGSAMELQKGHTRDFIRKTAAKLKAPAFTATIMGDKCLFIADSSLLPLLFRETKQLDGLTFQKRFMQNTLDFTSPQMDVMFDTENGTHKAIMNLFHKHLIKEDNLATTLEKTQTTLVQEVDRLIEKNVGNNWTQHNLFEFVSCAIFRASAGPILSMNLNQDCALHLQHLRTFEKDMGLLFVGAPQWLVPQGVAARQYLADLFNSPLVKAAESPFLQERRSMIHGGFSNHPVFRGIVDPTIARFNVGIFLATVGNSIQAVFWTLLHLMEDPEGYAACRQAVLDVTSRRSKGKENNVFTMQELDELTVLQSAFLESLRIYHNLFLTRQAVQDIVLNPKDEPDQQYVIEKGTMIFALPNTMHMDPEIFTNPESFRYDRFVDPQAKSSKGTLLSSHLRPFGGGAHMCPGRKFIGYEARALLAMLLWKYDIRLASGESLPGIDFSRQGASVCLPERDVKMQIRLRT